MLLTIKMFSICTSNGGLWWWWSAPHTGASGLHGKWGIPLQGRLSLKTCFHISVAVWCICVVCISDMHVISEHGETMPYPRSGNVYASCMWITPGSNENVYDTHPFAWMETLCMFKSVLYDMYMYQWKHDLNCTVSLARSFSWFGRN